MCVRVCVVYVCMCVCACNVHVVYAWRVCVLMSANVCLKLLKNELSIGISVSRVVALRSQLLMCAMCCTPCLHLTSRIILHV